MSKIDEALEWLESKAVDFDYTTEQDTTIASWVTIPQVMKALRTLRPYVELGEYVMNNWKEIAAGQNKGEFIIEGQDDFLDLINQIKDIVK